MASTVIDVPLGLHLEFPGARPLILDLSALPCQPVVRELARALAERTNTTGPIASPVTARAYVTAVANFCRWLGARAFAGGLAELTEALVFDYWRRCPSRHEAQTRTLLAHLEERSAGTLDPAVVAQLHGVRLQRRPSARPRAPLSAGETARLLATCRQVVTTAEAARAGAEALVARGADPATHGWQDEANLAWLLDRAGPHTTAALADHVGVEPWRVGRRMGPTLRGLHHALFPIPEVTGAFAVLVALETGIPPEGLVELGQHCVEWVGASDARITWSKARGGGAQNRVFASRGSFSPGRLVQRWLAHSARARRFAVDPTPLWLCLDRAHLGIDRPREWTAALDRLVADHGLHDDNGVPLRVRFSTLRPTYFARHDRHWNGALRIDPNHSGRIEGDHYLGSSRTNEAIDATVEAAQRDALRRAAAAPLTVLSPDALARLGADLAAAAAELAMAPAAAEELLAGQRDVFVASCKDFHHSPFGQPGAPCPVPAWVCLTCPLAVFVPSKVPNLLRLRDHLERQWLSLPAAEWLTRYGAAHVRLERDVLPQFSEAVIAAARAALDHGDDDEAFFLGPEVHSWAP